MYNIKTLNKIASSGIGQLKKMNYNIGDDIENPDGIVVRSAAMHDYEFPQNLRAVARAGAGTNNIPIDRCTSEGIVVFNTPGANANAVKELAVCALALSSRDIIDGIMWADGLKGSGDVAKKIEKGKGQFVGQELEGKTLGVVGLGAIGVKVGNVATKLGMMVCGYDPFISVDAAWSLSRSIIHAHDLRYIYENCEYITLHVPLTDETKHMINSESISQMRDGVRIINLARGELVNDADILAALESGKVSKYVTDFPSDALIGQKGVIAIPHLGASTEESEENCARMAADELIDYLENGNITNSVNLPNVHMDRSGAARICLIHRNIPNMLSGVLNAISARHVNIENLTNKSKGDYAYTMLDITEAMPEDLKNELKSIEGVLRVRLV